MGIMNTVKGQCSIDLGGATFQMIPTFTCMCNVEDKVGDITLYVRKASDTVSMPMQDVVFIVHQGIVGSMGEKAPEYEEIGQWIIDKGIINCITEVVQFLSGAILDATQAKGTPKKSKKKKGNGNGK